MKPNLKIAAVAISTIALLAGCMSEDRPSEQTQCNSGNTDQLVGLINPTDEQIMEVTGASAVRRVNEGQPMTMELLPYRATVIVNAKSGEVTMANCS